MKINKISAKYQLRQSVSNTSDSQNSYALRIGYGKPQKYPSIGADLVFGSNSLQKRSAENVFPLINVRGLPDPCTGVPMITKRDFESIKWPSTLRPYKTDEVLLHFKRNNYRFYNYLAELNKLNPADDFVNFYKKNKNKIKNYKHRNSVKTAEEYSKEMVLEYNEAPAKVFLKIADRFKENMLPNERKIFDEMTETSLKNPNTSVRKLLVLMRAKHIKPLIDVQLGVISDIKSDLKKSVFRQNEDLNRLLKETSSKIKNDNPDDVFRKKTFSVALKNCVSNAISEETRNWVNLSNPEKTAALAKMKLEGEKFVSHLQDLPHSESNIDAFVVKYAGKNVKNGNDRFYTSKEIISRLIRPSVASIEHTFPTSPLLGEIGGVSDKVNYLAESTAFNNMRASMPFYKFIDKCCPDMPQNSQKYIDKVIDLINKGQIKGFETYPKTIKEVLYYASHGKIELDISKLDKKALNSPISQETEKFLQKIRKIKF